ncbi:MULTISPECIES: hypothetical protein [unclassified Streptomyces]|uniref:hypothetical protein n=1 Tax=unclassified Streptomyces TaxID=2593676 RepID=UPI000DD7F4F3|nr:MULTISPECIES: hypothetical protein [unclassified Streptomyces]QZZ29237.1 hypothetical protein A7X85_25960 [Streptomyces sp. ST1015]
MKGNGRDAAGCLLAVGGAGSGLALWSVGARGRFHRFEAMSDWSVVYAELPLAVLGGTAAGLLLWATLLRRRKR